MFKKIILLLLIAAFILSTVRTSTLEAASTKPAFTDTETHWAKIIIDWAIEQGIVNGYADGTYKPNASVSEAEFVAMLLRAFHAQLPDKENNSNWSDSFYSFALEMNYPLSGYSVQEARNRPILRSQVALLIAAADGQNFTSPRLGVSYLYSRNYASGVDPNLTTYENFQPLSPLTRAEAVTFIYKLQQGGFTELKKCPDEPLSSFLMPETSNDLIGMKLNIMDALHKKFNESQFGSYVILTKDANIISRDKFSVVFKSSLITTILDVYYSGIGGEHKIVLNDDSYNSIYLAMTILTGAKLTVEDSAASDIKNLFRNGGTYSGSNFRAERPDNYYGQITIYFKNMVRNRVLGQ